MNNNEEVLIKRTASRIKKARLSKSLTQADVAARAGINVSYYAEIERGVRNPSTTVFQKVVRAIGVKADDILES